jgi:hypothetical protein
MKAVSETIQTILKSSFTVERMRAELKRHLVDCVAESQDPGKRCQAWASAEDIYHPTPFQVMVDVENDRLTILYRRASYNSDDGVNFKVVAALGAHEWDAQKSMACHLEKCLIRFYFNHDLSCYTLEFFVESETQLRHDHSAWNSRTP